MIPARDVPDTEVPWQPRLGGWSSAWRWTVMIVISVVVFGVTVNDMPAGHDVLLGLDLLLGMVSFLVVPWRRRFPRSVAVLLTLFGVVSSATAGPGILAAFSLATRRRWTEVVGIGLLSVVTAQVWWMTSPGATSDPWWLTLSFNAVFVAAFLMAGMYVGSRRELLWSLRERAERAESEQALRVEQARATERARIAREMHDVLGHRISLVTMHAGALSYRDDLDREQVADSAQVILDNAQLAMSELRSVLGLLRSDDGEPAPDQPPPTLRDLRALVEEARTTGMTVELRDEVVGAEELPVAVARTVYRVVQEGLTNVRKHAPATHAVVSVAGAPGRDLVVRVSNPLPVGARSAHGTGFGIVGLAERAELTGGELRSRTEDGRFELEVTLPWPA